MELCDFNNLIEIGFIKRIHGFDNYYISKDGKIFSYMKNNIRERKLSYDTDGYLKCNLTQGSKYKCAKVHRILALTFIENPNNYPVVNHKDGDKINNHIDNLEWCTISYNTKHAYDLGLAKNDKGYQDSQSKPVIMYNIEGNILGKYGSINEAHRMTKISVDVIKNDCRKLRIREIYFRYDTDYLRS